MPAAASMALGSKELGLLSCSSLTSRQAQASVVQPAGATRQAAEPHLPRACPHAPQCICIWEPLESLLQPCLSSSPCAGLTAAGVQDYCVTNLLGGPPQGTPRFLHVLCFTCLHAVHAQYHAVPFLRVQPSTAWNVSWSCAVQHSRCMSFTQAELMWPRSGHRRGLHAGPDREVHPRDAQLHRPARPGAPQAVIRLQHSLMHLSRMACL